jgi:DNA repair protein RecO (recombination protein O)
MQPALVLRYFDVHLLAAVGYQPQLFYCVGCKKEIMPQDQYFSPDLGGVLCPACGKNVVGAYAISMNSLKYLRHFQRSNFSEASRAHLSQTIAYELENIMHAYYRYLLEQQLNTPAFLRRVAKTQP